MHWLVGGFAGSSSPAGSSCWGALGGTEANRGGVGGRLVQSAKRRHWTL